MRPLSCAVLVILVGCSHAPLPQLPTTPDIRARERAYAAAELRYDGNVWRHRWHRADGDYDFGALTPALDEYPSTHAARKRARNRSLVVALVASTGGGLIGTAAGNQVWADPEDRYQRDALITLYGGGAVLILAGLVLDRTWVKDAYRELTATYNDELRRDLALPPLR